MFVIRLLGSLICTTHMVFKYSGIWKWGIRGDDAVFDLFVVFFSSFFLSIATFVCCRFFFGFLFFFKIFYWKLVIRAKYKFSLMDIRSNRSSLELPIIGNTIFYSLLWPEWKREYQIRDLKRSGILNRIKALYMDRLIILIELKLPTITRIPDIKSYFWWWPF